MDSHDVGIQPIVEGYGCTTCGVPLTVITTPAGGRAFLHSRNGNDDHEPNPVPLAQLAHVEMTCDFCSAPRPVASFTFAKL